MTQQEDLSRAEMSLIELAEYLRNVSETCRTKGVSGSISMVSIGKSYETIGFSKPRKPLGLDSYVY